MFTGIIQEIGRVLSATRKGGALQLIVHAPESAKELRLNDSVAMSGVCLTVIERSESTFKVDVVEETLLKTTLGNINVNSKVNLELPVRLSDRLGGHLVQGHVDGKGSVTSIVKQDSSWLVSVEIPNQFCKYVIPVGSITIDGVSLTVASVQGNRVVVSLILHTLARTTLSELREASEVNIEFDLVGKYIERLLTDGSASPQSTLSTEKLRQWGYEI